MGCSSSKIIEMTNHNKTTNLKDKFPKEKMVEAILISKKIQNVNEFQDKLINIIEKSKEENNLLILKKENSEEKVNQNINAKKLVYNFNLNQDNAVVKILNSNLNEKKEFSTNNVIKNSVQYSSNNLNNKSNLSNYNFNDPEANKNLNNPNNSNKFASSNNHNFTSNNIKNFISQDKKLTENFVAFTTKNSKGFQNTENNNSNKKNKLTEEEEKELLKPSKQENKIFIKDEIEKAKNKKNILTNKNSIHINNNNLANESAISKLSLNLIKSKVQNLKDINIAKDENELILNLTKTQNLTHFQDDIQTKNILNSIDKEDNLILKFNTGGAVNSLLNNTNFKINESQSQQNISNINNNPSICEENKSDRFSFKFDLTSNFDLHSKFSKFDSTNNISRIKVPYYDNLNNNNNNVYLNNNNINNYEQNYLLTNASHVNDLNNLTNLNNNNKNNNININNNTNFKTLNNLPAIAKSDKNLENLKNNLNNNSNQESNENLDEEETQLSISLSVRASKFEAMYPIWIEKNKEVEFKVIGKWTIDSTFPMCDCNGYVIKNKKEANCTLTNNNNVSNMTNSTNQNSASVNNTNINSNSNCKNFNSNNLVLLNSPNKNENKIIIQEDVNKESNLVEVEKKVFGKKNSSDFTAEAPDSDNKANVNVNIENNNANKNEIKIGYIGPSTLITNNNENVNKNNFNNEFKNKLEEKEDSNIVTKKENSSTIELTKSNKINEKTDSNNNDNNNNINININKNNSNGLNCLLENYPNGCLIGRVLGGPYFRISSKCTFISEHSGPLFLKMNIHDLRLNPEGKLSVFINGAEDLPFMSIEKKLGWDINSLSLGCQFLKTESERLIYTFINKIRINSNLFAQQYLENIKTLSNTTNSVYVSLFENKKSFKLLNMDAKMIEFGKRLVKREIERLFNLTNNNLSYNCNKNNLNVNLTMNNNANCNSNNNNNNEIPIVRNRQEILENENKQILEYERNLNLNGYSNLKYFIKKHEDTKPLSVAIKIIIDEKARQEILSKESNSVGLLTIKLPQAQKGFYTCLVFANFKSEQNLITEINRNETEIMMTE